MAIVLSPLPPPAVRQVLAALAYEFCAVLTLALFLRFAPPQVGIVANVAWLVIAAACAVSVKLGWSWRHPLRAWLVASALAPMYLLLVVLVGLEHFGGWFDVAFVVVCLSAVMLTALCAVSVRVVLRKRNADT